MRNPLIERLLKARRIAVVGISDDPSRPSHHIAQYLIDAGYNIIPVNPNLTTVLDRPCYPTLHEVPGHIDLINIFRRSEFIPTLVSQAIAAQAGGVWVQSGIRSPEAVKLASASGLDYIEDHCIMVEHARRSRN